MNQFKTIFQFELKNYLKNKIFVGVTVFLVAVIVAVMFFPQILEALDGREKEKDPAGTDGFAEQDGSAAADKEAGMLVFADSDADVELVRYAFTAAFPEYDVRVSVAGDGSLGEAKAQIESGEAECAFLMDSPASYTYYVENLGMYDANTAVADEALEHVCRMGALVAAGVSAEDAEGILNVQIEHETESLGKDQRQNFFYTYIMIFALYMVILLYGQMVATNVATEKSSRAMELLITSAKPVSMMFGKVIASCLAGFLQLVCVFGSAVVCYNANREYWGDNLIISSVFAMPADLVLYMLLFFVLGFFIYAFMFGAVGSTASKLEDINTSVMPITLLFVISFLVVIFSMSSGNVDNILMLVCSYIPFTSPMAMFTRIAMSTVPAYEIVLSVVILIGSVIGIGVLSAKIYRVGVLLYGTTPKPGAIIKAVRRAS